MTTCRHTRAVAFARPAAISFAVGLAMSGVYWSLDVAAPAPPLLSLAGLLGVGCGERVATALWAAWRRRRRSRRSALAEAPAEAPAAAAQPENEHLLR